jgi:hypothetical protein
LLLSKGSTFAAFAGSTLGPMLRKSHLNEF